MHATPQSTGWQALFGRRLRFLRTLESLTQSDLAGRLGITVEHLSNMERGASAPSFSMVIRLAEALGTEPANLFLFARDSGESPGDPAPGFEWTRYIAAVGSYEYVAETGMNYWSDSLFRLLGMEPGEVEAGPEAFASQVHPEDRERAVQAAAELKDGQDLPMQSFRVVRKDGRERFVLTHRTVERDASGRLLRLHGVLLDVTEQRLLQDSLRTMHANLEERVRERTRGLVETVQRLEDEVDRRTRAEAKALESESRLRSLGDNLADGAVFQVVLEAGGAQRLAFASAGLAALLGSGSGDPALDLEGMLAAMLPEDRVRFSQELGTCFRRNRSFCLDAAFRRPGRGLAWVRIQAACRIGESGEQVCDGLVQDISDLKQAEEDRALAVQRLQRAHALARLGHWEFKVDEDQGWWSDELYEAFGHEPQSRPTTLGFFLSHVHPDDREDVARRFAEAVAGHREYRASYRIIRKDGRPGFGYSIGRPTSGSRPGQAVFHGTFQDVTEHKAACEAIRAESEGIKERMAAAGLGAWAWEGEDVRFDAAGCAILGLAPDHGPIPVGEVRSWLAPEDLARRPPIEERGGQVRITFREVVRMRPPGCAERRVLLSGILHRNPKGLSTRAEGLILALDDVLPK